MFYTIFSYSLYHSSFFVDISIIWISPEKMLIFFSYTPSHSPFSLNPNKSWEWDFTKTNLAGRGVGSKSKVRYVVHLHTLTLYWSLSALENIIIITSIFAGFYDSWSHKNWIWFQLVFSFSKVKIYLNYIIWLVFKEKYLESYIRWHFIRQINFSLSFIS